MIADPHRPHGRDRRLRLLSWNVRHVPDGRDRPIRRRRIAERIADLEPDICCLQEVGTAVLRELRRILAGYQCYAPGREDGRERGERVPILVRRERCTFLDTGHFWLAPDPSRPMRGWDAACRRLVTVTRCFVHPWGGELRIVNCHFDHRGSVAREAGAELIVQRVLEGDGDEPVVMSCDLNAGPDSTPYTKLVGPPPLLLDSAGEGPGRTQPTWQNLRGLLQRRLDYVLLDHRLRPLDHQVRTERVGRRPLSDHRLVQVEFAPRRERTPPCGGC